MQPLELLEEIKQLDLEGCRLLSRGLRRRIGVLAATPSLALKDKCKVGVHASVRVRGWIVTGLIENINGNAVMLRFKDARTVIVMMSDLLPDKFDLPITELPPLTADYCAADDAEEICMTGPVVRWHSWYYVLEPSAGLLRVGRRLLPASAAEAIPSDEIVLLEETGAPSVPAPAPTKPKRHLEI